MAVKSKASNIKKRQCNPKHPGPKPSSKERNHSRHGHRSSLRRAIRESLRDASTLSAALAFGDVDSLSGSPSSPDSSSLPEPDRRHNHECRVSSPDRSLPLPPPISSSGPCSQQRRMSPIVPPSSSSSPRLGIPSPLCSSAPASSSAIPGTGDASTSRDGAKKKKTKRRGGAAADEPERMPSTSTPAPKLTPTLCRGHRGGWHGIKEIVGEGREHGRPVYLVEWEGQDPNSGVMWPCSWVNPPTIKSPRIYLSGCAKWRCGTSEIHPVANVHILQFRSTPRTSALRLSGSGRPGRGEHELWVGTCRGDGIMRAAVRGTRGGPRGGGGALT